MRRMFLGASCIVPFVLFAACSGEPDAAPGATTDDGGGSSGESSTDPPGVPDAPSGGGEPDGDGGSDAEPEGDAAAEDAGSDATPCTPPATPPKVVFLNRGGGTYTPGATADSRTNTTPIVSTTATVFAWTVADTSWQALVACVKNKLLPFNVVVTETDPGNQEHIEVVFAQAALPALLGQPAIAPFTCNVVPNGISFVSQAYAEANPTNGCAVAVQNVGYTLGLESVTTCPDAMTFDPTACADAPFTNVPIQCGHNMPTACQCGPGSTQSSYARLLAITGPRCL